VGGQQVLVNQTLSVPIILARRRSSQQRKHFWSGYRQGLASDMKKVAGKCLQDDKVGTKLHIERQPLIAFATGGA